ncbi:hypothetical protein RI367_001077 [Sorochytrium milnesiophthora]
MSEQDEKLTIADGTQIERTIIPKVSGDVIEMVLDINELLVKLCCEYQNKGWIEDADYKIYQARLQSNLLYLCSVVDDSMSAMYAQTPIAIDYSPLPVPRAESLENISRLLTDSQQKLAQAVRQARQPMQTCLAAQYANGPPQSSSAFTRVFDIPPLTTGSSAGVYQPLMPFESLEQ